MLAHPHTHPLYEHQHHHHYLHTKMATGVFGHEYLKIILQTDVSRAAERQSGHRAGRLPVTAQIAAPGFAPAPERVL